MIASVAAAPVAHATGRPAGTHQNTTGPRPRRLHVEVVKPGPVVMRAVPLWHGTPSYVLRPNHRTAPDVITGISGPCQVTAGNHSGTWSPAACPRGYEVQGDLTVPVGKTLAVKPGTTVYFDTTAEGALGVLDPSELPDLVVDGTLTVAGSAKAPVLFTSANAAPTSTLTPAAGDWGYVFFNHTGADKGTGSLTHLRLLYGEGIASDRSAPPITDSRVGDVAAGTTMPTVATSITKGAGIDYEDVPHASVAFNGDTFNFGNTAGIAVESVDTHTGFSGATYPGNPVGFTLVGSSVTGGLPSGFSDEIAVYSAVDASTSAANHDAVTLNVHGDTFANTGDGEALDVSAVTDSTTVPGTAEVSGAFHDNSVVGGTSSSGLGAFATAKDSSRTGIASCGGASACVTLPLLHNTISTYRSAVDVYTEVDSGSGGVLADLPLGRVDKKTVKRHVTCKKHRTCTKTVTKLVDVSGGTYQSDNSSAVETGGDAEGSGNATARTPVVATTFRSDEANIDAEVSADQGTASNTVTGRHLAMTSLGDSNVVLSTNGSTSAAPPAGSSGGSHTTIGLVGGHLVAGDQNVDLDDASAGYGPVSSAVTVNGTTLTADEENIDAELDASKSGGSGGASSIATVTGSTLVSGDQSIDDEVNASYGSAPASSTVSVTHSSLNSGDQSVFSSATSSKQPGSSGSAVVDTTFAHDTAQSDEEALDLRAESDNGGSATSDPKVIDSTVFADEEGVENEARSAEDSGQGSASARPAITGSTITSGDEALENEAEAKHGNSAANGSFTISGSTLNAIGDAGVGSSADGSGTGASTVNPSVKNLTVRSTDDDGFSLDTESAGSGPMRIGGSVTSTTVHSEDTAFDVEQNGAVGSPATYNTVYKDDRVVVNDDSGFAASIDPSGASATLSPTITGGSISAPEGYAVDLEASGYGGGSADSLDVAPAISHETTFSEDGVKLQSRDTNGATAPGSTVVGGSLVDATIVATDGSGIDAETDCSYCAGGARTAVKVVNTPVDSGEQAGLFRAEAESTTNASASVGGSVTSTHHDLWAAGDGAALQVNVMSAKGGAASSLSARGLQLSGSDAAMVTAVTANAGAASYTGSVTGVTATNRQSAGDGGIFADVSAATTARDTGSVSHNIVTDSPNSDAGISEQLDAGTVATESKHIEDNVISKVGTGNGIYVGVSSPTKPARSTLITVSHNTISRTGNAGIEIRGATAAVTSNVVSFAGESPSSADELGGVYADDEPYQGSVTCNVIWGNGLGIQYGATNPTAGAGGHNGDPRTNDNSFTSPTGATLNSLDLRTANAGPDPTDAQDNYWDGTPRLWAAASSYDTSPVLKKAPACTATAGA